MGVPKFFRYISERYPCLSEVIKEYQIPEFDNLYLDMNGIIHVCSHPNDFDPHFRITEEQIFRDIFHYIEILFRMIQPQRLFFMAVDGVAPRAKMNQQRGRRFRSAKEAEVLEKKALEKGEILPNVERFDSNCITPGTGFMVRLQAQLKYFVSFKVSTDKLWQKVKVILSGHETPGEGEHKIMDYIRFMKSQPEYDPNTRHCLYGLDADLIMLGLCTHEPHFALLREEVKFGKKQKRISTPEETTFFLLHLSLMREYLDLEFQKLKTTLPFPYDLENIIDDWVLMGFLVGNDFIPNLPNLHIDKGALPLLYQVYIDVMPTLNGYINEGGNLKLDRFQKYLEKLAEFDLEQFKEHYADIKFFESKTGHKPGIETVKDPDLAELIQMSDMLLEGSDEDSDGLDSDSDDDSTFMQEFTQHKNDYYVNKLQYEKVTPEVLRSQAECFVRAIQWNLHYYYHGCCSWSWFYPHHYAPFISDVKNFTDLKLQYDLGKPFHPYEQLLAVLPSASKSLLPEPLQELMVDSNSPLINFYPTDFKTDMNGKRQEWEGVVLIPFIEETKLLSAMEGKLPRLTDEERERNTHGPMLVYTFTKENLGVYKAPNYFPILQNHHAKETKVMREEIYVDKDKLIKGLCPRIKLDVYFPGFPTLKHIPFTAELSKSKVKVFELASRGDNMILKLTSQSQPDIVEVANQLLGKTLYVNWPHLIEAKVQAVANLEKHYTLSETNTITVEVTSEKLKAQWKLTKQGIETTYLNRLGVDVGKTEILVYCSNIEGRKYIISHPGKVTLEKQWCKLSTAYGLQTTVRDLAVHDPTFIQHKTLEELFPVGSAAFMLTSPQYGAMGTVVECDKTGQIKLKISDTEEPDLSVIQKSLYNLRTRYMPANVVANRLAINTHLLSRVTGNIFVLTGDIDDHSQRDPHKLNIGLNLKFNKRNEEVCGFTRRESTQWLYSTKAMDLVHEYMVQFPQIFQFLVLKPNFDIVHINEVFPEKTAEQLASVTAWLKEQPAAKAERQTCGAEVLEQKVVEALEEVVIKYVASNNKDSFTTVSTKPHLLYQPKIKMGIMYPDPSANHNLFDRVTNVRDSYSVPLGLRGTIIGIHTAEKAVDTLYDILFDQEFPVGIKLRCTTKRGYRMFSQGFINLSYGNRIDKSKNQAKPTAVVQPSGSTSEGGPAWVKTGHNSAFTSWKQLQDPPAVQQNDLLKPHFMKKIETPVKTPDVEKSNKIQKQQPRTNPVSESKSEFQNFCAELQKSSQSPKTNNMPKTGPLPPMPPPESSSSVLKKMLKIADDPSTKPRFTNPPNDKPSQVKECTQLLSQFQLKGLGTPSYSFEKGKNGILGKITDCHGRMYYGAPSATQEQAAESAARAALLVLNDQKSPCKLMTNAGQNFYNPMLLPPQLLPPYPMQPLQNSPNRLSLNMGSIRGGDLTPPTPPQQWYQQCPGGMRYTLRPEGMSLNWRSRMAPPVAIGPMNMPHPNFVPPIQHSNKPSTGPNYLWPNQFIPLQADAKMRQLRGESTEKLKQIFNSQASSNQPPTGQVQNKKLFQPSPSTSGTGKKPRKCRIAAKFDNPIIE